MTTAPPTMPAPPTLPATLHDALLTLPPPAVLPRSLPVTHLSIARCFDTIVAHGGLAPTMCKIFHEKLVYLFYGGAFYRPANHPTENAAELPVAFVFSPRVLPQVRRYFPFDTGAVASGKVGKRWQNRLQPWPDGFRVSGPDHQAPAKIVYHLFGSNEGYSRGVVDPMCSTKPHPLPLLHDFLAADLSKKELDQRQRRIECQFDSVVALDAELEWVGFPHSCYNVFRRLCDHMGGKVPDHDIYSYSRNFNPYALAQMLEQKAHDAVIGRYLKVPA